MGDAGDAVRRAPDTGEIQRRGVAAQDGLIVDEEDAEPRFVLLAARFSLRLCWAFFLSVFWEPLSLFATVASSGPARL